MNPERFREAYGKLQALDDRLTHRVRPRTTVSRSTTEQVEDRLRDLATYTIELKDVIDDLFQAIAAKPD